VVQKCGVFWATIYIIANVKKNDIKVCTKGPLSLSKDRYKLVTNGTLYHRLLGTQPAMTMSMQHPSKDMAQQESVELARTRKRIAQQTYRARQKKYVLSLEEKLERLHAETYEQVNQLLNGNLGLSETLKELRLENKLLRDRIEQRIREQQHGGSRRPSLPTHPTGFPPKVNPGLGSLPAATEIKQEERPPTPLKQLQTRNRAFSSPTPVTLGKGFRSSVTSLLSQSHEPSPQQPSPPEATHALHTTPPSSAMRLPSIKELDLVPRQDRSILSSGSYGRPF
jgi:hypothetical protein